MNRVLVGLVLVTLLSGMLAFAFGIQLVKANGTVYIRADGSIDPPTASMQRNGNVYTLTGNIASNVDGDGIVVQRDDIAVDGSGFAVEGTGAYNYSGIYLDGNNVTIQNTNIKRFYNGIYLAAFSNCCTISGNTIAYNGFGFYVPNSSNNSIDENTITNNGFGLYLSNSSKNSISGNTITNNGFGLYIPSSSNNSISGNTIANSTYGIEFFGSSNNIVCHNNFVDNTVQVDNPTPRYVNLWDNGCEGNYWSNYNGTDLDNDGVGDTFLPCVGVGNYPLMNVYWNPCDISHDLKVDMRDVGKSAKAFGTVSGDALWNPHADITGPEPLVADGEVDMQDISLIASQFGEHYP